MTPMNDDRVLVTLCTYNESGNIAAIIAEIQSYVPEAHILVIDDGSPDGTGNIADAAAAHDPRIQVIHRAAKMGLGSAMLAAFRFALERNYAWLVNLDADFSHSPKHIPELLACQDRADVAIGSRYISGGGVVGWGPRRHFMSRGINFYARLLLGLKTRDNSGSFRAYRLSRLGELDLDLFVARGYAFEEEVLYRLRRIGCRFAEIPIVFQERRYGSSKINWREAVIALWVILRLGVECVLGKSVTRPPAAAPRTTVRDG